jgi:activator of HSP90 ATPase
MALVGENDPRWIVADRQDGKNVNAWHWEEKDLTKTTHAALKELFESRTLVEEDGLNLRSKEVTDISGDVTVAQRKGKIMCYFEVKMTIKWGGKVGDDSVDGKMTIPEIEHDNFSDDFDINVTTTDSNAASSKAEAWIRANGRKVIRTEIKKYFENLFKQHQVGTLTKNATAPASSAPQSSAAKAAAAVAKPTSSPVTTSAKTINWTMQWRVPIDELFAVLMNEQRAAIYTRAPAKINPQAGGQFEFLGGVISGYYVDVQAPNKITMQWRLSSWASGVFSSVVITLSKDEPSVTRLEFAQAGIPDGETERVMQGWRVNFFDAIKMVFGFGMEYL